MPSLRYSRMGGLSCRIVMSPARTSDRPPRIPFRDVMSRTPSRDACPRGRCHAVLRRRHMNGRSRGAGRTACGVTFSYSRLTPKNSLVLALTDGVLRASSWWACESPHGSPRSAASPPSCPSSSSAGPVKASAATAPPAAAVGSICYSALPSQAHDTLDLIDAGGPFPYEAGRHRLPEPRGLAAQPEHGLLPRVHGHHARLLGPRGPPDRHGRGEPRRTTTPPTTTSPSTWSTTTAEPHTPVRSAPSSPACSATRAIGPKRGKARACTLP